MRTLVLLLFAACSSGSRSGAPVGAREDAGDRLDAPPGRQDAQPRAERQDAGVRQDAEPPEPDAASASAESGAEACDDAIDNDGDRLFDCHDPDCAGSGVCGRRGAEDTPARCSDGIDNDRDGFIDCVDYDCQDVVAIEPICGSAENTDAECSNGLDDDADGAADCMDPSCSAHNRFVGVCATFERTDATCADRVDNDGDGAIDCADSGCAPAVACGGSGFTESTDADCGDGIDNDSDGEEDCFDRDCDATFTCRAADRLVLSEVLYNPAGTDDGREWIELFNGGATAVDLTGYTIRSGGTSYGAGQALSLTLAPGDCAVVGGPISSSDNDMPAYAETVNFMPDLSNGPSSSTGAADAVALFDPAGGIVDAVIYGEENTSGLADQTGTPGTVDVGNAPSASSVVRVGMGHWTIDPTPTPNDCGAIAPRMP